MKINQVDCCLVNDYRTILQLIVKRFKINLVESNSTQTNYPPDTRVTYSQCTTVSLIEMLCFGRDHVKCIDILWLPQCWNPVFLSANLWLTTWNHREKTTLGNKELSSKSILKNGKWIPIYSCIESHFVQNHSSLIFQGEHADSNTHQSANKKVFWT